MNYKSMKKCGTLVQFLFWAMTFFCLATFVCLSLFKFGGYIQLSWLWVFSPFWIPAILFIVLFYGFVSGLLVYVTRHREELHDVLEEAKEEGEDA